MFEAFGYDPEGVEHQIIVSYEAGWAIAADSLVVGTTLQLTDQDGVEYRFALHPDQADDLAERLHGAAEIARSKSLDGGNGSDPDQP